MDFDNDASTIAQELGFTAKSIESRLRMFDLQASDKAALKQLQPLMADQAPELARHFFEKMDAISASHALRDDAKSLEKAIEIKVQHLKSAVAGNFGQAYVLERIQLALLYVDMDVEVAPLNASFRTLMDELLDLIMAREPDPELAMAQARSLGKVMSFDLSLISEVLITLRETAIRRLGEEASQYARSLIEASLDPLVTISVDGKITDVNEATIAVTGVDRERLIGTDFSNYFTEPDQAREGYQQVFSKGLVRDYPLTIRDATGRLTEVLYNATVYKDAAGNVGGVFAAARDVTAQAQASQYARSLIEASLDPLVTISGDGKITDVNEATMRATGASREDLIGTDFSNYFTEPDQAREGYQQVFDQGFVTDYPLTIRHASGRTLDVLYNAAVYRDTAGDVLGVFAAARDVTDQKQASQYARSLIEASLDPLVTISVDGKITDVNDGSVKATGIARERLIGTDFSSYFTEPGKAQDGYQQVFDKGFVTDYPLTIRHSSGRLMHVLYNASVYKDAAGEVLGVFAAARDVTKQKEAEAEIAEQRKREMTRLAELERFNRLTVGRELKMIELKAEIEELRGRPKDV